MSTPMDDTRQMPAMWKLFVSVMASGLVMGLAMPLVSMALGASSGRGFGMILGVSLALGLGYAFAMYVFVKVVLRSFVRKMHTLERVVAGTRPPELPGVFVSNEIDEVEKSAARIIAEQDAVRAKVES